VTPTRKEEDTSDDDSYFLLYNIVYGNCKTYTYYMSHKNVYGIVKSRRQLFADPVYKVTG
jgi:hypothetical protein